MKTHTSSFKEQIKLIGKEIDSRITFGDTVLGKDDLNAVTPSYQGAILKSVMKQLDIDSNVAIPIGTILKYEFGLKVNGEYEYINYGNYVVYSIERQEDTNSYKIVCYDKLLYSMLDYVKLPITYPISIRDYINAISTALGLTFANKNDTFANYDKQIQADLYDGLGYTFRDVLDELAQVTASTICLNNNDELEIRYITETNDTIDEEFLKDVNVNFGEKFGAVNTIVLSRSGDSDSVYYPSVLPSNPYEIKISDNQIMNGNDRADFLPDIYNKLNGLEFYTNDFVSTGIIYYDLCDRYSVKVGDNTYSCVMFNDEVLVTQGLEENVYTELPEQTETDYKHASKDDRMINQVYIIAKKNEAEILALVSTTETIQKEINPTKDESGSEIITEDASNNPLINLEIEGKSEQATRSGKNLYDVNDVSSNVSSEITVDEEGWITASYDNSSGTSTKYLNYFTKKTNKLETSKNYTVFVEIKEVSGNGTLVAVSEQTISQANSSVIYSFNNLVSGDIKKSSFDTKSDFSSVSYMLRTFISFSKGQSGSIKFRISVLEDTSIATDDFVYEPYGVMPSPDYPSEIESVGTYNEETGKYEIEVKNTGKNSFSSSLFDKTGTYALYELKDNTPYTLSLKLKEGKSIPSGLYFGFSSSQYSSSNPPNRLSIIGNGVFSANALNENGTYYQTIIDNSKFKYAFFYPRNINIEEYFDVMLTESSSLLDYEPYKSVSSLFVLDQPLRSLPNGVKDKLYVRNNKLYVERYVGSVVLDGSESGWTDRPNYNSADRFVIGLFFPTNHKNILSNYFTKVNSLLDTYPYILNNDTQLIINFSEKGTTTLEQFKTWLSTHNTQVDYELAEPYTEELGEIEMPSTYKGVNNITTTDELFPIINLTYVRDTIIADYVENHVAELKITESEIKSSVERVSTSVNGLNSTVNRVEEITNDNSQVLNIISTNIDRTSGEVREVTTTTGFTFNKDGMTIDDGSGFKAEHRAEGTYYKDGTSTVGQYTKDGSKQKDLELFGVYSYGKNYINDTPMFVAQLYTDENGEECFGHFVNI